MNEVLNSWAVEGRDGFYIESHRCGCCLETIATIWAPAESGCMYFCRDCFDWCDGTCRYLDMLDHSRLTDEQRRRVTA